MDWSKIKTIFIITFLILDVYLLFQFMKVRDANKYEVITEASFEEKLKADEIKFVDLPKDPIKAQYLSAKPKMFNQEDIKKLKGQTVVLSGIGTTSLHAKLEKPLQLTNKFEPAELSTFLTDNVLFGEDYQFGEKSNKDQTITYYQRSENFPLFKNINGMIIFKVDEDNQIVSYEQTFLEEMETLTAKEEILKPLKAIETLHQKGMLKSKSKITRVELGYSTLIQLAASQVLAPTWRFEVDGKESLFVNAFEGQIIQFNSDENSKLE